MFTVTPAESSEGAHTAVLDSGKRRPGAILFTVLASVVLLCGSAPALAQHEHIDLWSTAEGGGVLTAEYDPAKRILVFESFCAPGDGRCLYTSINPAFLAPTADEAGDEFHRLQDGTRVAIEIVAIDPALAFSVNGNRLDGAGESANLGTMPNIHNHPSWQLLVAEGEVGDYSLSYRFTTDSPHYETSEVFTSVVTNDVPTPAPTPTATPSPKPRSCPGDCDADGAVSVDELVRAINEALGREPVFCAGLDTNLDDVVTIDEVLAAVGMALVGCPALPTPAPVDFQRIQDEIFTPNCLSSGCHNSRDRLQNLVLEDGEARGSLVGVRPENFAAASAGLLRVDPGHAENSFLLVKLGSPRPEFGSPMPLERPSLSAAEIELIRAWIAAGAPE